MRVKNRMRVIRSSGSVRGGAGDIPAYSAEGERNPAVRRIGGYVFVGGVTVALDDAPIAIEQLQSMDGARPGA